MKITPTILYFALIFICNSVRTQNSDTLFVRYDSRVSDSIEYLTDTLFRESSFGPHFLFETDFLPNTRDQLQALGYGLQVSGVRSKCVDKGIESGVDKILLLEMTDSSLVAKYKIATNCCYNFLCDMEVVDSNTINLKYTDYGTICGCTCYHELSFEIDIEFLFDEYEENYNKLKFITLNGKLKTVLE